jgi:hypothetical protein
MYLIEVCVGNEGRKGQSYFNFEMNTTLVPWDKLLLQQYVSDIILIVNNFAVYKKRAQRFNLKIKQKY